MDKSIKKISFRKIVFVIVMSYCCFTFYNQFQNMRKIQKVTENKKVELKKLQDENYILKEKASASDNNDSSLTERYIREKLKMIKQGESIVQNGDSTKH